MYDICQIEYFLLNAFDGQDPSAESSACVHLKTFTLVYESYGSWLRSNKLSLCYSVLQKKRIKISAKCHTCYLWYIYNAWHQVLHYCVDDMCIILEHDKVACIWVMHVALN